MDWKPEKWKLHIKGNKERWLVILAVGLILLILAFPIGGKQNSQGNEWTAGQESGKDLEAGSVSEDSLTGSSAGIRYSGLESQAEEAGAQAASQVTYEQQLEARLKELLSHVEGVGEVEVMIVLKSSEEKVWRTDRSSSYSSTKETDSNGGTRDIQSQEATEDTILVGQSGSEGPLLEKEIKPVIGGVVVSATGGGSPSVQAEISAAVEALFDVPSHKIKVLKRAE